MLLDFWTVHFHFEYRDLPKGHPPINRPLDYLADKTVSQKCYKKKKKIGNPALYPTSIWDRRQIPLLMLTH